MKMKLQDFDMLLMQKRLNKNDFYIRDENDKNSEYSKILNFSSFNPLSTPIDRTAVNKVFYDKFKSSRKMQRGQNIGNLRKNNFSTVVGDQYK